MNDNYDFSVNVYLLFFLYLPHQVYNASAPCFKVRSQDQDQNIVAVDRLNLTMYEGQIFCLLGHNGAGMCIER